MYLRWPPTYYNNHLIFPLIFPLHLIYWPAKFGQKLIQIKLPQLTLIERPAEGKLDRT